MPGNARAPLWAIGLAALLLAVGRRGEVAGQRLPPVATRSGRLIRRSAEPDTEEQPGRGCTATAPSEIPTLGWKNIFWRVYGGIEDDRILANAAAVVFYALLALFPALAALVSIYGLFTSPGDVAAHLDMLTGVLPGGAIDVVGDQLHRLAQQPGSKLGIGFVIGLAVSLWSANGGVKALFDALNVVYEEEEKRSFMVLNSVSLAFTISMLLFLLVAIACVIVLPLAFAHLPRVLGTILGIARWPVLLILMATILAVVYRFGPSRRAPHCRWISWGSAFAAVSWLAVSALFSWYAANFGSFNKTYGSLGAVIGCMTWMWLSIIVILLGAKLNAEIEHQTAPDTTDGSPKPIGARGARMADTIGSPS
jgi:membrane protein